MKPVQLTTAFFLAGVLAFSACSKTKSEISASTASGPTFSNEQILTALRSVSLRTRLTQASPEDVAAIESSTDAQAAFSVYSAAVDKYVDSADFNGALQIYFRQMFGMGGPTAGDDNAPANLATYIVMNDKPYSELLTANYKLVDGVPVVGQDSNTPSDSLGGFATLKAWLTKWYANGFAFDYVREIARITECVKYPLTPGSEVAAGAWDEATISPKYHTVEGTGFACFDCHKHLNPRRGPFLQYNNQGLYQSARTLSNAEPLQFGDPPQAVVEPRTAAKWGFTSDFALDTNSKPAVGSFMSQIAATDAFKDCSARRFLSFALGYESAGLAGNNLVLPFDFCASSKPGDCELLAKWKERFVSNNLQVRPFLVEFFKDADFINRVSGGSAL